MGVPVRERTEAPDKGGEPSARLTAKAAVESAPFKVSGNSPRVPFAVPAPMVKVLLEPNATESVRTIVASFVKYARLTVMLGHVASMAAKRADCEAAFVDVFRVKVVGPTPFTVKTMVSPLRVPARRLQEMAPLLRSGATATALLTVTELEEMYPVTKKAPLFPPLLAPVKVIV